MIIDNTNNLVVFDCEVYKNYFLVCFQNIGNNKTQYVEITDSTSRQVGGGGGSISAEDANLINVIFSNRITIGFNSLGYDLPILSAVLSGATCREIKELSDRIIVDRVSYWDALRERGIKNIYYNYKDKHIDIMGSSQAGKAGLKLQAGRINSNYLQELPIQPDTMLENRQMKLIFNYCFNDLSLTKDVFNYNKEALRLREVLAKSSRLYSACEFMSFSNQKIAEVTLNEKLNIASNNKAKKFMGAFSYVPPEYLEKCDEVETAKVIKKFKGIEAVVTDNKLVLNNLGDDIVAIDNNKYKIGSGGLHSEHNEIQEVSNDEYTLFDVDVASYYPNIILNNNLYPRSVGKEFINAYRTLVTNRLQAKQRGETENSDVLKIVINGLFGKLNNRYSNYYDPMLFFQVTATGQLSLLMLIEMLGRSCKVVSANTDGVICKVKNTNMEMFSNTLQEWETLTRFNLDKTKIDRLQMLNVNNYFYIADTGKVKTKGMFQFDSIQKSQSGNIIQSSIIDYYKDKTPVETTIDRCNDLKQFIYLRSSRYGIRQGELYLGKAVRFFIGEYGEALYTEDVQKGNKNTSKIPDSNNAYVVKKLEAYEKLFIDLVDKEHYKREARKVLERWS